MHTAVDLFSYILHSVDPFNLEINILQFGEFKNIISSIISPALCSLLLESQLYMYSLSGSLSLSFPLLIFLLSVFRTFPQLWFLLPTFSSQELFVFQAFLPSSSLLTAFYFYFLDALIFLFLRGRWGFFCFFVLVAVLHIFFSLQVCFFQVAFWWSCLSSSISSTIAISLDVFHLFWAEMVKRWLEVLSMREEHVTWPSH